MTDAVPLLKPGSVPPIKDAATSSQHDVIVIGGSSGGLAPLQRILADLPADLPAAVFVVLHIGATSHLTEVLNHRTQMPVMRAVSGQAIEPGHIYVAIPGVHLLLHDSHILLRRGPRENMARPAIDPLFRSAACSFGGRVIGVLLSGALSDGSAGLRAIKRCNGVTVVQDPRDAAISEMPINALRYAQIDHVVAAHDMASLLVRLTHEPAGETPPIPLEIRLETAIAAQEISGMDVEEQLGSPSRFTCPECHGTLWEINDGALLRYRCHVGHAFTAETMLDAQTTQAEEMLWGLLRSHQERAALVRRMAEQERTRNQIVLAEQLMQRARDYDEDAAVVRSLLRDRASLQDAEVPKQETP